MTHTWTPGHNTYAGGFLYLPYLPRDRSSKKNSTAIKPLLGNFINQGRLTHLMKGDQKWTSHPVRFCHKLY